MADIFDLNNYADISHFLCFVKICCSQSDTVPTNSAYSSGCNATSQLSVLATQIFLGQ